MSWEKEKYFFLAQIGKAHGIKGELKMKFLGSDPTVLSSLEEIALFTEDGKEPLYMYVIENVRGTPPSIIKLNGIEDRTSAERLSGLYIAVTREELGPLEDNQYYIADLVGMRVFDEQRGEIGKLRSVLQGTSPNYQIARPGKKDLLLPTQGNFLLNVDFELGIMYVNLPEGLWDIFE